MQVVAVAGLAQNFAALRSLTNNRHRTGAEHLNQFDATDGERILMRKHFKKHAVSHSGCRID
jgi:hydroxymethylglutaryl-CoA reductase